MSIEARSNDIPKNRPHDATHWAPGTDNCYPAFAKKVGGWWRVMGMNTFEEGSGVWVGASTKRDPSYFIEIPEQVWATVREGGWNHDSLAELIRENTEHDGTCAIRAGTIVWRGLKKFDDPEDFVPGADDIINTMANNAAGSDGGEFADDYPNVTEEAQAELNEYLIAWARKHAPATGFYGVVDIEQYTVTAEDLAQ